MIVLDTEKVDGYLEVTEEKFGFTVKQLDCTVEPGKAIYMALHQCYCSNPVKGSGRLSNEECEEIAVKRLLEGNKGHYSPFEAVTIQFGLYGFPHSMIQQLLRSRIGVSPAVQSFRYTSEHIIEAAQGKRDIEDVIYLRPVGIYHDREQAYDYTQTSRMEDLSVSKFVIAHVAKRLKEGMPPEQARGMLNHDYRQHAIFTYNLRSLMGMFDRRTKKDAQCEIQILAKLMYKVFEQYTPKIAEYYTKHRLGKAILSP